MSVINFFSSNTYLFLPTKSNPKVALVVDNELIANNAFKLYNPFSAKAKYLKSVSRFLYYKLNSLAKRLPIIKKQTRGDFIEYLEGKLNITLVSSVYYATANDKVVLQLQSNNKIIGYVKFPLNDLGVKHLTNEIKAIQILSEKHIVSPPILMDSYQNINYLFLEELKGEIKEVSQKKLLVLLQEFKKSNKYKIKNHPSIKQLTKRLKESNLQNELEILEKISNSSKEAFYEVYEHGDFAPWNLITDNKKIIPFDFEYFEEIGLEYMDLIKYYFQLGSLLQKLSNIELIDFIIKKIKVSEINILVQVFLIKEILRKTVEEETVLLESEMLYLFNNGKV